MCDIPAYRRIKMCIWLSFGQGSKFVCNKCDASFDSLPIRASPNFSSTTSNNKPNVDYMYLQKKMVVKARDFNDADLAKMQTVADLVELLPAGYEKLSGGKISGGFSRFRVDQWKSWCLIYSPFVLINIIPD